MSLLDGWIATLEPYQRDTQQLRLSAARNLAKDWRIGWYVAPRGNSWEIGKMTVTTPFLRFAIVGDDDAHLHFPSVERALEFYRKELGIVGVAMFQS